MSHNDDERKKIEAETHRYIVARDNKHTSFLEVSQSSVYISGFLTFCLV